MGFREVIRNKKFIKKDLKKQRKVEPNTKRPIAFKLQRFVVEPFA